MTDKLMNWVIKSDLRTKLFILFVLWGGCGAAFGGMAYFVFGRLCR